MTTVQSLTQKYFHYLLNWISTEELIYANRDIILSLKQEQQHQLYPGKNSSVTKPFTSKTSCFSSIRHLHSTHGFPVFPLCLSWKLKLYFRWKCKTIPIFRLLFHGTNIRTILSCDKNHQSFKELFSWLTFWFLKVESHTPFVTHADTKEQFWRPWSMLR